MRFHRANIYIGFLCIIILSADRERPCGSMDKHRKPICVPDVLHKLSSRFPTPYVVSVFA